MGIQVLSYSRAGDHVPSTDHRTTHFGILLYETLGMSKFLVRYEQGGSEMFGSGRSVEGVDTVLVL